MALAVMATMAVLLSAAKVALLDSALTGR
eukprot:SAG31_NODE_23844_length_494_cov_1.045570_1_plen_28_part_01